MFCHSFGSVERTAPDPVAGAEDAREEGLGARGPVAGAQLARVQRQDHLAAVQARIRW